MISPRFPIWLLAAATILLVGCSKSKQLHTAAEAKSFIGDVARGANASDWRLAGGASGEAARAWAERGAIQDMGSRLRHTKAAWACEFAEGAAVIGFGKFTPGDGIAVTQIARRKGATPAEITPLLADVTKLVNPDLKTLKTAVCG